jgi:hypothetical protein
MLGYLGLAVVTFSFVAKKEGYENDSLYFWDKNNVKEF